MKIPVELTAEQVKRLNSVRGKETRASWMRRHVVRALDRISAPPGISADEALQTILRPYAARGGFTMPLEEGEYPTIAELAQIIGLPPPGPATRGGGEASGRDNATRCIYMSWQEKTGWPWPKIMESWGYERVDTAQQALTRYIANVSDGLPEERRSYQLGIVHELELGTMDDWRNPPFLFDIKGDPVRNPDGSYARDMAQRNRTLDSMVKLLHRRAQIEGSDAAVASKIEVNTTTAEWRAKVMSLLNIVMPTEPEAIEGEVVSDSDDLSADATAPGSGSTPPAQQQDPENADENGQRVGGSEVTEPQHDTDDDEHNSGND
jgi:hypothetical protein